MRTLPYAPAKLARSIAAVNPPEPHFFKQGFT
jgi:hypothetical protein